MKVRVTWKTSENEHRQDHVSVFCTSRRSFVHARARRVHELEQFGLTLLIVCSRGAAVSQRAEDHPSFSPCRDLSSPEITRNSLCFFAFSLCPSRKPVPFPFTFFFCALRKRCSVLLSPPPPPSPASPRIHSPFRVYVPCPFPVSSIVKIALSRNTS